MPKCLGRPATRVGNREGNQRRGGMMGTVGGTAQGHQRDAPPSVHRPDGPPRPPHLALPRPAPPAPRPHPRLAQEHGTHDERTTTQGRTTFVTSERASLLPEPRSERDLPAPQAHAPAGGGRAPLRAASYHQPRHQRTRLGHLPGRTALHLHSAAAARLGCGFTSDPGSGPYDRRP